MANQKIEVVGLGGEGESVLSLADADIWSKWQLARV